MVEPVVRFPLSSDNLEQIYLYSWHFFTEGILKKEASKEGKRRRCFSPGKMGPHLCAGGHYKRQKYEQEVRWKNKKKRGRSISAKQKDRGGKGGKK